MSKKLNLTNLKSQEKETFTTKKVVIGEYELNIDTHFRDTKIIKLLKEFLEKITYAKEKNIEINLIDYGFFLLIKHFTDCEMPNELEKQLQVLSILTDLGYTNEILNNFGEEEINKFSEKMKLYGDNMAKLAEDLKNQKT